MPEQTCWTPRQKIRMNIPYLTAETVLAKFGKTIKPDEISKLREDVKLSVATPCPHAGMV